MKVDWRPESESPKEFHNGAKFLVRCVDYTQTPPYYSYETARWFHNYGWDCPSNKNVVFWTFLPFELPETMV